MPNAYLLDVDGSTRQMAAVRCVNEDKELQQLLEKNPDLLAGEQINPDDPRRWLLVRREMPVPDPNSGENRWSIDFFFVDQAGMPTFVECKRFNDTRARREVVGQMLEYAANAQFYWDKEKIKGYAEESLQGKESLESALSVLTQNEVGDADAFFNSVVTNLKEGRIRLIFFQEHSANELRSIVDFLNKQMQNAEVLIVEARQYTEGSHRVVIPTLFGYTDQARAIKVNVDEAAREARVKERWDRERFFEELRGNAPEAVPIAEELLAFGEQLSGREAKGGTGKERGSFTVRAFVNKVRASLFSVYTTGEFSVNFGWNRDKFAEVGFDVSEEFRALVNEKLGTGFDQNPWEHGWPLAEMTLLEGKIDVFKEVISNYLNRLQSALGQED